MPYKKVTIIDGHNVACSDSGVLVVNDCISVLGVGTHVALNVLGKDTKKKIVTWWKSVRGF